MSLTLGKVKEELARMPAINLCADDPRMLDIINRSVEQLIVRSSSEPVHRRIRICADNACVTFPRQVAAITDVALCTQNVPVRNQWYEFLSHQGVFVDGTANCNGLNFSFRGTYPSFADMRTGSDGVAVEKIKVYADVLEDIGTYIWLRGYDENNRWIRTEYDGVWYDGERIDLALCSVTPQTTVNIYKVFTSATKPVTKRDIRLYSYDTVTTTERALAVYQWDEESPAYQRYLVNGGQGRACVGSCSTGSNPPLTVTGMAKLNYMPAHDDQDQMMIDSIAAIRYMALSIAKMDRDEIKEATALGDLAMQQMKFWRDHVGPREQLSIQVSGQGSAWLVKKRIGVMR